jgi:hypothetical protein
MAFPVDEHAIVAAEDALGFGLPKPLRARLARCNGGEVTTENDVWELHPVLDPSNKKRLLRSFNDIVKETNSARQWARFPAEAIAVASNGSGDYLIAFAGSEDIFEWCHETGDITLAQVDLS